MKHALPLDFKCPTEDCWQPPGARCVWRSANGKMHYRRPHAARVLLARKERARHRLAQPPPPG